tara:strand:+ start:746 stop:943 length:198 start_codon:yes stop_codon:yes gene_type:complete
MRYTYKIKPIDPRNEEQTLEAMSYKKMLKSLVLKFPKQLVTCYYTNKKNRPQAKIIDTKDIKIEY